MTLHPIRSEFPYVRGQFSFLFYQCIASAGYPKMEKVSWTQKEDDRGPLIIQSSLLRTNCLRYVCQVLSREPQKKKTYTRANCSAAPTQQALCLRLALMYKAESWQRAVTLDNSTPQCRITVVN
jgi:hypothetical protein